MKPSADPKALDYEPGNVVAGLKRNRRMFWISTGVVAIAVLLAVAANWRSWLGTIERWQQSRAFARMVDRPAADRFPQGEVTYAVPPTFASASSAIEILYGQPSPASRAVEKELTDAGNLHLGIYHGPILFAGSLTNRDNTTVFSVVSFYTTRYFEHAIDFSAPDHFDGPSYAAGFHVHLTYTNHVRRFSEWRMGGEGIELWLAPPSALAWEDDWRESLATPLPLTFYGSFVDPKDPSIGVIPFKFDEYRGEIRYSARNCVAYDLPPDISIRWISPVPWLAQVDHSSSTPDETPEPRSASAP